MRGGKQGISTPSRWGGARIAPGRRPRSLAIAWLAGALVLAGGLPVAAQELAVEAAGTALAGRDLELTVILDDGFAGETPVTVAVGGRRAGTWSLGPGEHRVTVDGTALPAGRHSVEVVAGTASAEATVRAIPGWLSIVPPLLAIALALLLKDVLVALYLGVFAGALIIAQWRPVAAFARSVDTFILPALADTDHVKIVLFTVFLGGMVGLITRSGGTQGIVLRIAPFATTSRRGQLATWLLGVAIFFDDYANTLIVGSTMRPITDRLRISREKLAYIVDSTAAPVTSVVPISTWIGFEVGLIAAAVSQLGLEVNAFSLFLDSIPYRFYPLLALVLGFTIAASGRDFGPMLRAERRAAGGAVIAPGDKPLAEYTASALDPPEGRPRRAFNAVLPILTVVGVTLAGLVRTGRAALAGAGDLPAAGSWSWWREVIAASDSLTTLLWASFAGLVVALLLPLVQRLFSVRQGMEAMVEGCKAMLMALVVLTLAWSIGAVCDELHTAAYVVGLTEGVVSVHWLPVLVFLLSAAVAFSTGTSWGTMAILIPLVIPVAHGLAIVGGQPPTGDTLYMTILVGTVSSVLAGSVWGDHCSPISDTTILSSTASSSDHMAHVRTQLPYALAVGVLGMAVGDIPTAYGMPPWISLAVGAAVIVGVVLWLGKKSDQPAAGPTAGPAPP
ncbi:MAG TPA: Na+/H+ antiporter NhaC family protein [Thermoanaerobaculia bacterium]|nr:Na+/H+ antiporter NhaC family protein [Thermoanaerobaculia bacterium]